MFDFTKIHVRAKIRNSVFLFISQIFVVNTTRVNKHYIDLCCESNYTMVPYWSFGADEVLLC